MGLWQPSGRRLAGHGSCTHDRGAAAHAAQPPLPTLGAGAVCGRHLEAAAAAQQLVQNERLALQTEGRLTFRQAALAVATRSDSVLRLAAGGRCPVGCAAHLPRPAAHRHNPHRSPGPLQDVQRLLAQTETTGGFIPLDQLQRDSRGWGRPQSIGGCPSCSASRGSPSAKPARHS